jgi:DNA-binding protein HU-beta
MNKAELIAKLSKDSGITKVQAGKVIESFQDAVKSVLKKKDKLTLVGFGTFKVVERKAREGRNPKTGEKIKIKATKLPKFVPGKELKSKI